MSKNQKVLENFEPFNEIWYIDCFYHALLPIAKHFNKDLTLFHANQIFIYNCKDNNIENGIYLDDSLTKDRKLTLKDLGISINGRIMSDNIIPDLKVSIDNKKPVVIVIDCYYVPFRNDVYMRAHHPHVLLIYGYDDDEQIFYVLDQKISGATLYEKFTIAYSDLKNCYNEYFNNIEIRAKNTYMEFYNQNDADICGLKYTYKQVYFDNFLKNKEKIYQGLEHLQGFRNYLKQIIPKGDLVHKYIINGCGFFMDIVNYKKVEKYCAIKMLESEPEFLHFMDSIINDWTFIRSITLKLRHSCNYNKTSFNYCVERLERILENEIKWYDSLYSIMQT